MSRDAAQRLIVALDSDNLEDSLRVAKQLQGVIRCVKIGSTLFTALGPMAIRRMRALGFEVFLDLKFHDIPSIVEKSCRAAVRHRVWMLTVHVSGQQRMLEAAVTGVQREAARCGIPRPRVVGVTVLTSIAADYRRTFTPLQQVVTGFTQQVTALAVQAKRAGLDGVVTSAREAAAIRRRVGERLLIVCPGIRLPAAVPARLAEHGSGERERQAGPFPVKNADQVRVASPREALANGADFLIVGRPVMEARNPRLVVQEILAEMERV